MLKFLLPLIPFFVVSQTDVSGIISNDINWTIQNSPYLITNNVRVNSGVTLTIDPGVEILFNGSFSLQIFGELQAVGANSSMIKFSSARQNPQKGDWKFIEFSEISNEATFDENHNYISGSRLENVIIEFGGDDTTGASVKVVNTSLYIYNSIIRESGRSGIVFEKGTGGTVTKSVISNSQFYFNEFDGIRCNCYQYNKSLVILNTISRNNGGSGITTSGGDSGGNHDFIFSENKIYLNQFSGIQALANGNQLITKNIIFNNNHEGIYSRGSGQYSILNNIIFGNEYGITAQYANHNISKNIIVKNEKVAVEIRQGGSYLIENNMIIKNEGFVAGVNTQNAWSPDVYIRKNLFAFNNSEYATVDSFSPENGNPTFDISNNKFYRNNAPYEFRNRRPSYLTDIDASSNFWDTNDENIIAEGIFDWFDDSNIGLVNYTPINSIAQVSLAVLPNTNLHYEVLGNGINFSWDPNIEQNISGYILHFGSPTGYSYENNIDLGLVTSFFLENADPNDEYALTAYTNQADGVDDMFDGNQSWYNIFGEQENSLSLTSINKKINFYPNPTKSIINISAEFNFAIIYSMNGQKMIKSYSKEIDLSELDKGFYLLKLVDNSNKTIGLSKIIRD